MRQVIIPGVHLPEPEVFSNFQIASMLFDLSVKVEETALGWLSASGSGGNAMKGSKKSNLKPIKDLQDLFTNTIIENKELLPANYKHFGKDDMSDNLILFLKNNPFFTSSLVEYQEGLYECVSSREKGDKETWFTKLVDCLDDSYLRVNVRFDKDFKIHSFVCYKKGEVVHHVKEDDACAALVLLLVYYSECVHALIHVLHMLMVTCIYDSTLHSDILNAWAEPYYENVYLKYEEVCALLFSEGGTLTGGSFRSNRDKILNICHDMISVWGSCESAREFVDGFLLAGCKGGIKTAAKNGILTEFSKHLDLCRPYGEDLSREFERLNKGDDISKTNANIKLFLSRCGDGVFTLSDIGQWVELMTITGILHGATLSFTRLLMTAPIASLESEGEHYTMGDAELFKLAASTLCGTKEERSVFSNQIQFKENMNPGLKQVMTKYAALNMNLRAEYYNKICNTPEFLHQGWVLTDYCLEGIDGKQATLVTYI
jgi:hypothetical protein